MQFEREIGRLMLGMLILLFIVMGSSAYWVMTGPEAFLLREDNPRQVEFQQRILRGSLYDSPGELLVQTIPSEDGTVTRNYLHRAFDSALGYYSFRYGAGGVEASVDALLSGSANTRTWEQWFDETLLHQARVGVDVRLSLNSQVQEAIVSAMQGLNGAAVVLNAQTGEIVALASLPTYDPNTLDTTWETLVQDPSKPFFNRVLQGSYQAGGTLQIPLMAVAHLGGRDVTATMADATGNVQLGELTVTCAIQPPTDELSMEQAFAYGCPQPFASLVNSLDETVLRSTLETFDLGQAPTIDAALPVEPSVTATPAPTITPEIATTLLEDMLGQGNITVNPLSLARYLAAVVNDGTAPPLRLVMAQRPQQASEWQLMSASGLPTSLLTSDAAQQLESWFLANSITTGIAPEGTGSHIAISRTGDKSLAWFAGFRVIRDTPIVIVVVLEDQTAVERAAQVALAGLQAYQATASAP